VNHIALDAHCHCGLTVPFAGLAREWELGGIDGGVLFAPVEEVYHRENRSFADSDAYRESRRQVHKYLLEVSKEHIFPYFFVWNDFAAVPEDFAGVKWHRHPGEPVYRYETQACSDAIEHICERHLPVVLEEEFANTLDFIRRIAGRTVVIIPHMGMLNGGYQRLKSIGAYENRNVWVDTALSWYKDVEDFAETYGTDRILFGSDYPFGIPSEEKTKVVEMFSGNDREAVLSGNLLKLLDKVINKRRKIASMRAQ